LKQEAALHSCCDTADSEIMGMPPAGGKQSHYSAGSAVDSSSELEAVAPQARASSPA